MAIEKGTSLGIADVGVEANVSGLLHASLLYESISASTMA
jgi:hypothetical protein